MGRIIKILNTIATWSQSITNGMRVNLFSKFKKVEPPTETARIPDIFHDYDIRGSYPEELSEDTFSFLAQAAREILKLKKVALGRDSRLSSPVLAEAFGRSLLARGVDVIDVGMITAPMASWLAYKKGLNTFLVTASHNPPNENGLKIYSRKLGPISFINGLKDIEEEFERLFLEKKTIAKSSRAGFLTRKDFIGEYQREIIKLSGKIKGSLRVALDYSNGTAGLILNNVLDKLGIGLTTINEDPNGAFPGHHPNPLRPETHQKIQWLLKKSRYQLGAIFDGDGDRIALFDEKGNLIPPAQVFALLVDFYLPASPRSKNVVVTASFSKIIRDVVREHKGQVYVSAVGRTNVGPLMKKKHSLMAAERSGHYFFKEFNYQDNAVLALLKLLKILSVKKQPLSKLVLPFQKYIIPPEINLPFKEGSEQEILRALRASFPGGKVSRIDGLTIEYKSWWFNLRVSNTQDLWRLTLEGTDGELLKEKQAQIEEIVRNFKESEKTS